MEGFNVTNAPKTATFQMRINPQVKDRAERIFAKCGLTLTDAINIFIQQSMNVEGLPFMITQNSDAALKSLAVSQLMSELKAGRDSVKTNDDWVSEDEMRSRFGIGK